MRARRLFATALCLSALASVPCQAWDFGEGYSSPEPGLPSNVAGRAFTIYTGQEACEKSPKPRLFRISPNPMNLTIGERMHEHGKSDVVIEAYDENGQFLPSVPIGILIFEYPEVTGTRVVAGRSDWEYFEAFAAGEAEYVVGWRCATPDGTSIRSTVRIYVTEEPDVTESSDE